MGNELTVGDALIVLRGTTAELAKDLKAGQDLALSAMGEVETAIQKAGVLGKAAVEPTVQAMNELGAAANASAVEVASGLAGAARSAAGLGNAVRMASDVITFSADQVVAAEVAQSEAVELLVTALMKQKVGAADAAIAMGEASDAIAAHLLATGHAADFVADQVEGDYRSMIEAALTYQDSVTAAAPEILATLEAFKPVADEVRAAYAGMAEAALGYSTAATEAAGGAGAALEASFLSSADAAAVFATSERDLAAELAATTVGVERLGETLMVVASQSQAAADQGLARLGEAISAVAAQALELARVNDTLGASLLSASDAAGIFVVDQASLAAELAAAQAAEAALVGDTERLAASFLSGAEAAQAFGTTQGELAADLRAAQAAEARLVSDNAALEASFLSAAEASAVFATSEASLVAELEAVGVAMRAQSAAADGLAESSGFAATATAGVGTALGGFKTVAGGAVAVGEKVVDFVKDVAKYAALGTAAIDFLTVHYAKQAVELANLATVYAMTNAEIASLASLAGRAGVPVESLREGMVQFEKSIAGVGDGAKRSQAILDALGISLTDAGGHAKSANDVLLDLADVFQKLPDGEAKTAAAAALGGESFAKLVPILSEGRDAFLEQQAAAEKYGTALTALQVAVGKEVVGSFNDAKMSVQGLGFAIQTEAGPAVAAMLEGFADWISANRELLAQDVKGFINAIRVALQEAAPLVVAMGKGIQYLGERIGLFPASLGTLNDQLKDTQAQIATNERAIRETGDAYGELAAKNAELRQAEGDLTAKILAQTPATRAQQEQMHGLKDVTDEQVSAAKRAAGSTDAYSEMLRKLQEALKGSASGAGQAAHQVDEFNAAAAKATAAELAQHVSTLAKELERVPLPEAIERLPGLLNLNQQALDAEVQAIQAETEKKLSAAKSDKARAAALAEETDRIDKATAANAANAQKLVDTVTHTESATKITEQYAQTLATLKSAQDALELQLIDEQIKAITSRWNELDTATRQAELPQVLTLLQQKYAELGQRADEANQKLIENARATYDAAQAAYALTGSEQDLNSMVAALNALWGITDQVQSNAAMSARDLAIKLDTESQAARDAASGTREFADSQQLAAGMSSDLAKALTNLLTSGEFKDVGKQLFSQILDQSLVPFVEGALKSIVKPAWEALLGDLSFQQIGTQVGSFIAGSIGKGLLTALPGSIGAGVTAAASNEAVKASMEAGMGSIAMTASESLQAGLMAALPYAGAAAYAAGVGTAIAQAFTAKTNIERIQGGLDAAMYSSIITIPFAVLDQITGGLVTKLLGSLFGFAPSMNQRIAEWFSRNIGKSLQDDQVLAAVDAGAKAVGDAVGSDLLKAMTHIPVKQIHQGLHDQITEAFAGESAAVQTEIQQLAQAAGTAVAAQMNFVGSQAIAFSQQWANAWIRAQVEAGRSAQQIIKELQAMDASLGTSGGIFAALDELNAKLVETGKAGQVFQDLGAIIKDWTGAKKAEISSLSDVLAAFGGDTVLTLNAIKKAFEDAGIPIEQFGGDLGDVVLAFAGDAGAAIQEAGQDFRDFGNDADGTAEILRQKVLSALDDVISTAEQLGYSSESVDAFRSAVALIPPEMLKNSEFADQLRKDFETMAANGHMSVRELVDSIDPPLPAAMRNAILATNDLGKALGALSGAPLSSIKEVTDRMKQFAGDMYREVKDDTGKVTKVLTAFGEQTVGDLVSAVGGMWDTITEDGKIATGEIDDVFRQIGMIPEEVFNDPAVQDAVHKLLAKIGEQTGDATLIALAASSTITKEQLDAATAQYDQWVKDHPPPPPPATTPTAAAAPTDGATPADTTAPTGGPADTTAAGNTPPPQPIPPETQKSWDDLTASAVEYAKAVLQGGDAVQKLSAGTVSNAAAILAAIKPIYGTPDDEQSLAAIQQILKDLTDDFLGQSGNLRDDFDKIRGGVEQLTGSVDALKSSLDGLHDVSITVTTKYVTEGGPDGGGEGHAAGHYVVPGPEWAPRWELLHGQERVLSVSENRDYEAMLRGLRPSVSFTEAPTSHPSYAMPELGGDPGLVSIRMSRQDAADAMVAPIFVRLEEAQGAGRVAFKDAKGRPVSVEVDAHTRGKARAR